ncbi:MAG: AbiV family abortive infection protein [Bacteroidota bacterium]|nr:AbiV family abortive infection protein [Bacteroidota bacterium]
MNTDKLNRLELLAFKNALRLHQDSIHLYKRKSYPSAFVISVLASEEFGKVSMLNHWSLNWYLYDNEWKKRLITDIYSHVLKQRIFQFDFDQFVRGRFLSSTPTPTEHLKQRALYVGLPRVNGKVNIKGRISSPANVTPAMARMQITMFNDLLLDLALGIKHGYYMWDTFQVQDLLNNRLISKLISSWRYSTQIAAKQFRTKYGLTIKRAGI